ncbi:MAG: DUF2490 domain-containing protein [Verrucomicrobiota bacterium]|jgi:hypothetical protein|nr:DUF2490 domain-containing protein [Verrucomicrobiota bacterium]
MTRKQLALATLAVAALSAVPPLLADVDTQSRLGFSASFDQKNGFKLETATEQRINNDISDYCYGEYDVGFSYTVNPYVTITPLFRFVETRSTAPGADHSYTGEFRPMLNLNLKYTAADWRFDDRNRFEWRNYEQAEKDECLRYRNRLKISSPWKWTSLKINPFVSGELFQDVTGTKKALQNWELVAGAALSVTDTFGLDLYYMAELKEDAAAHDTRQTANIIGLAAKLNF